MESAERVRSSLGVAALAELHEHEQTLPDGEARVAELLETAGVFSWPLLVDAATGLILDGTHRARVLRRAFGARFAVVQHVSLDAADVRLEAWVRVLEGVSAAAFERARRDLGLMPDAPAGALGCRFAGRLYGGAAVDGPVGAHRLAIELVRRLRAAGADVRRRDLDADEAGPWLSAPAAVVLRLPAVDKAAVRQGAAVGGLPPKSTRFVFPYRVIGLGVPLDGLRGPRARIEAALARDLARPLVCLGPGLEVDRRYPERLWQFEDHRVPDRLFAGEAGRRAYARALARAAAVPAARP